ncbi:MAG: hypothetical protein AAGA12_07555 [Pseudomonadota bacterium]
MPKTPDKEFGPWNPGLSSTIPNRLMPRVTLFDPRYSFVAWDKVSELSEATGLKPAELAITRPERLALHSVLIRVTSQLFVPDGPNYADLGISLRQMATKIYDDFVVPEIDSVCAAYEAVREEAETTIRDLLEREIYAPAPVAADEKPGFFGRLFGGGDKGAKKPAPDPLERARAIAVEWKDNRNEDVATASRRAIARTLGSLLNKRGALFLDRETITDVAVSLVLNRVGSAAVGEAVEELFAKAVEANGYRRLPPQSEPLVLNAKGASASGKSSIRSAQREIAERLGYDWRDFAVISPDYWRKALIDYDGLGDDYKYAAMLTGHELEVIDRKLDILMAVKGRDGTVPHMLIDRFRFDSFQPGRVGSEDSALLTRFGSKIYLFFLVTPPGATVERAWARGVETGRYKAVDDLLFHNIEAYSGMPDLFFSWAKGRGKWVHYEFLDNSVERGERPHTIAYGQNGKLVVRDLERFCDIDRFRSINVDARSPDDIKAGELSDYEAAAFLRRALKDLEQVDVLVPNSETVFARSVGGRVTVDTVQLPDSVDSAIFGQFEEHPGQIGKSTVDAGDDIIGIERTTDKEANHEI